MRNFTLASILTASYLILSLAFAQVDADAQRPDVIESNRVVVYTNTSLQDAYVRTKAFLEPGTFTEGLNVIYADNLTIRLEKNARDVAVLDLAGTNAVLMEEIVSDFAWD